MIRMQWHLCAKVLEYSGVQCFHTVPGRNEALLCNTGHVTVFIITR